MYKCYSHLPNTSCRLILWNTPHRWCCHNYYDRCIYKQRWNSSILFDACVGTISWRSAAEAGHKGPVSCLDNGSHFCAAPQPYVAYRYALSYTRFVVNKLFFSHATVSAFRSCTACARNLRRRVFFAYRSSSFRLGLPVPSRLLSVSPRSVIHHSQPGKYHFLVS